MEAQFIYEKLDFERGTDPREALNIGLEGKLRNWLKKKKGLDFDKTKLETVLHYAAMDNQIDFVKYLIDVKKAPVTDGALNVAFANKADDEIIMYLISSGDKGIINFIKKKKARTVKESLDFERGLDPKDSLKIGIVNKRSFKTVRECAQFFIDNIAKLSEGRFKDANDLKRAFQDQKYANEVVDFKKNPQINKSPLRMSKDYLDGFKERDALGNTLSDKYPPAYIEEWGTDFPHVLEKLKSLRDFHIDLQKILGIHKEGVFPKIKESVNFERGINPKAAMEIGWRERIIQWFEEPHAFEDFYNGFYDLLPKKINRFTTNHWLIKAIASYVGHSGKNEITPDQFTDLLAIILYSNAGKDTDEVFKFSKYGDINDYDTIVRDGHLDSKIEDWFEDGALTDPNKFKKKLEAFPNDMYEDVQYEEEKAVEEEKTNKRISN